MKKFMLALTTLASAFAASALASTAHAQPSSVTIADQKAAGSGCPQGSASAVLSPDKKAITITFAKFAAQLDPTVHPIINEPSKSCTVSLLLKFPGPYSYSIGTVDHKGRADIGPKAIGQQSATYWFMGELIHAHPLSTTIQGFFFGDYVRRDTLGLADRVWSPCGELRHLLIDVNVSVSNTANPSTKAYINSTHIEFVTRATHKYGLEWRKCS